MADTRRWSPRRLAIVGFLVPLVVSLLVGIVGFGDPLREAIVPAVGTGIGCSIGFYLFQSTQRNSKTVD